MDALDDLLSELESPKAATKPVSLPPAPSRSTSVVAPSATDDLDSLLNDLSTPAPRKTSAVPAPAAVKKAPAPASDDLDSLLNDLAAPAPAPAAAKKAPAPKPAAGDDLDSLLNDLAGPTPAPAKMMTATVVTAKQSGGAAKQPAPAAAKKAPAASNDLDDLLNDLSSPAPVKPAVAKAPAPAPARKAGGDDLDDLLNDLAGPPKPAVAKVVTATVATAKVAGSPKPAANNDLDDILKDLAGPAKPAPAKAAPAKVASPAPAKKTGGDDLDDLLNDLSGPAKPAPAKAAPAKVAAPAPAKKAGGDDLDDLLNDLSGSKPKQPARNPSTSAVKQPAAAPAGKSGESLDDLMASLSVSGAPKAAPKQAAPAPAAAKKPADPLDDMLASLSSNSVARPTPKKGDDLDDLMAGLGATTTSTKPGAPPQKNDDLDDMLSSLQSGSSSTNFNRPASGSNSPAPAQPKGAGRSRFDTLMNSVQSEMGDINKAPSRSRGICYHCRQPIMGDAVQAMGRTYHVEHWACGSCGNPLGNGSFFEAEGQPMCERCYQLQHCPRCAHCNQAIVDRCVSALNKKWHIQCFVCTQCMQPFSSNFFEKDGRPYCDKCFYNVFAARCKACNQTILGDCINALGSSWHPEHFNCTTCHKSFAGGTFFEFEGMPYCDIHYHMNLGVACAGCNQPITGTSVDALGKKWHPEHLVCAFCMTGLAGNPYSEKNGKPYCKPCHAKLFH